LQLEEAAPAPSFSRHETFHLRYGWLKKAYRLLKDDPKLFVGDDAPIRLGVGKNMTHAMRFWGIASKVFEEDKKTHTVRPTTMGHIILDDKKGLDPYLERLDTMWLLHWLLYAPPSLVPAWWIIMNEITAINIETDRVVDHVLHRVSNTEKYRSPSPKSVKKDIEVFVHTYTSKRGKELLEDYLDCPFRHLHILRQRDRDEMRFVYGRKPGMSPLVVAFACLDFADRVNMSGKTIPIHRLAMEKGGPGSVFKISEADMEEMLSSTGETCSTISVKSTISATNLSFEDDEIGEAKMRVLHAMYERPYSRRRSAQVQEMLAR